MSTYPLTGTTCPACGCPLFYTNAERVVYCAYGDGGACDYERPYREGEAYPEPPPHKISECGVWQMVRPFTREESDAYECFVEEVFD